MTEGAGRRDGVTWPRGIVGTPWDGLGRAVASCAGNGSEDRKDLIRAVIVQKKGKG